MNWDIYSKLLLKECPQEFVSYCVPGARFVSMRETQFQTRAKRSYRSREMRGDVVIEAELHGRHFLIHVEWQSDKDEQMDLRLLGYCYEVTRLHKLSVLSVVIYLQAVSDVPRGRSISIFRPGDARSGLISIAWRYASSWSRRSSDLIWMPSTC